MRSTIVLVHGAFAESSSWDRVIESVSLAGLPVVAAANPLRGLASDAASVSDLVRTIDGPVLLVAHSYGGAVITNVDPDAGDITGLVYVAGFAPDAGETAFSLAGMFPGSTLGDAVQPTPRADGTTDLRITPDRFHEQFCADLPESQAALHGRHPAPGRAGGAARAVGRQAALEGAAVVVRVRRGGPQHPRAARSTSWPGARAPTARSRSRARRMPSPSRTRRRRRT